MLWALNQITTPELRLAGFLDLAAGLGCAGIECRNDLGGPLFDGLPAGDAGAMIRDKDLRLLGLSQIYPFNAWSDDRATAVRTLIATGKAAGAESVSLIPRNDGQGVDEAERQAALRIALRAIQPMLRDAGMVAVVEPLGFARSSLRLKSELVAAIDALGGRGEFRLVHDTFHHALAGGGPLFADLTGMVHVSGVVEPGLRLAMMEDAHRGLVDAADRLGNVEQLAALVATGYAGPVSFECFSPGVHAQADPRTALRRSMDFIESQLRARGIDPHQTETAKGAIIVDHARNDHQRVPGQALGCTIEGTDP